MGRDVTIDGDTYTIPSNNDVDWGAKFVEWALALTARTEATAASGGGGGGSSSTFLIDAATRFHLVGNDLTDNTEGFLELRDYMRENEGCIIWLAPGIYRHKLPAMFSDIRNFHLIAYGAWLRNAFSWISDYNAATLVIGGSTLSDDQNDGEPIAAGDALPEHTVRYPIETVERKQQSVTLKCLTYLPYTAQVTNFIPGQTVTGGTSGATGVVASDLDRGTTGTIGLTSVTGTFVNGEALKVSAVTKATCGIPYNAVSKFPVGTRVQIVGYDQQGYGDPPNWRFHEYLTVKASNDVTGGVTFDRLLTYRYDTRWEQGGKPVIIPLDRAVAAGVPSEARFGDAITIEGLGCLDNVYHQPDVAAWTAATAYAVGKTVLHDSNNRYICITAGTSDANALLGPTGTTNNITDGTVHWSYLSRWRPSTTYTAGQRRQADARIYICATGGTSASSGNGPAGTGTVTDGSVTWDYERPADPGVESFGYGQIYVGGSMSVRLINVRAGLMTPGGLRHFEAVNCDFGYCEVDKTLDYVLFDRCRVESISGATGCDTLVVRDCKVYRQFALPARNVRVENNDFFCPDPSSNFMGYAGIVHIVWTGNRFHHNGDASSHGALMSNGGSKSLTVTAVPTDNAIECALDVHQEPLTSLNLGDIIYTGHLDDTDLIAATPNRGLVRDMYWATYLPYAFQGGTNFAVGNVVRGLTSGASGTVVADVDGGAAGTLRLLSVTGTYTAGEFLQVAGVSIAQAGTPVGRMVIEADFETTPVVSNVFTFRTPQYVSMPDNWEIDRNNVSTQRSQVPTTDQSQIYRNNVTDNGVKNIRINLPLPTRLWVASTQYQAGVVRSNAGNVYRCVTGGVSSATQGPYGVRVGPDVLIGNSGIDGTCVWELVEGQVPEWVAGTTYAPFNAVSHLNRYYQSNTVGAAPVSVTAPTHTSGTVADDAPSTIEWTFYDYRSEPSIPVPIQGDLQEVKHRVLSAAVTSAGTAALAIRMSGASGLAWSLDLKTTGQREVDAYARRTASGSSNVGADTLPADLGKVAPFCKYATLNLSGSFTTAASGYVIFVVAERT